MLKELIHCWLFFVSLLLLALPASAQSGNPDAFFSSNILDSIVFSPVKIEANVLFDVINKRDNIIGNSLDTHLETGVRIITDGFVLDPAIASFLAELEFEHARYLTESNGQEVENNNDLTRYYFNLGLLEGTPGLFGSRMSAKRDSTITTGSLGSRSHNESESRHASINWKNNAFPMRLTYQENLLKQSFYDGHHEGGNVSGRDELLKIWTLKGRSSKLNMLLEQQLLNDLVAGRNNDFDQTRSSLDHRLKWGRGSYLNSSFNYLERLGVNSNEYFTFDELARIQHTDNIFSKSFYRYNAVTKGGESKAHSGNFELTHQLYQNLTTSALLGADYQTSSQQDETSWQTQLASQYQKNLFGATVNTGVSISNQEITRDSKQGLVQFTDESQVVPLNGNVILSQRFIDASSIIVTNQASTFTYAEGVHYDVTSLTGELTELQVTPGMLINSGDIILVSYKAQTLPSQKFARVYNQYNLGIDLGWVSFSHVERWSDSKRLSGADESFLNDTRDTTTNIEFRWMMLDDVEALVGAERRYNRNGEYEATTNNFRSSFSWQTSPKALWNLNMFESLLTSSDQETVQYDLQLLLNWRPMARLSIQPSLKGWKRRTKVLSGSGVDSDGTFISAGFGLSWFYGKTRVTARYHHNQRVTDDRETDDDRLYVKLIRSF